MPRTRKNLPKPVEKLVYQEAGSQCALCDENSVSLLEIHHIEPRAAGGSDDPSNLILLCRNCHGRADSGQIPREELTRRKHAIKILPFPSRGVSGNHTQPPPSPRTQVSKTLNISGDVISSIVANNVTIRREQARSRPVPPGGSIGANLDKRNYVTYLIERYHGFRDADRSYGRETERFNYGVIHKNIERKFKAKTFFIPEARFSDLVHYLQGRINNTVQGRVNRKHGQANYREYDEYVRELRGV